MFKIGLSVGMKIYLFNYLFQANGIAWLGALNLLS
jgi:hypothetical protein